MKQISREGFKKLEKLTKKMHRCICKVGPKKITPTQLFLNSHEVDLFGKLLWIYGGKVFWERHRCPYILLIAQIKSSVRLYNTIMETIEI